MAIRELFEAVKDGNLEKVSWLLEKEDYRIEINNSSDPSDFRAPLHIAVSNKNKKMCQLLLDHGANVNGNPDNMEYTPLHLAAYNHVPEIVQLLLERGADPLIKCNDMTVKETADYYKAKACIKVLNTAEATRYLENDETDIFLEHYIKIKTKRSVTEECYNKCLEIAVKRNNFEAAGYIMYQRPSNVGKILKSTLNNSNINEAVAMIFMGFITHDDKNLNLLKHFLNNTDGFRTFEESFKVYLEKENTLLLNRFTLTPLWDCMKSVGEKGLLPLILNYASKRKEVKAVACLLQSSFFCKKIQGSAEWHGLKLHTIHESYLHLLTNYRNLDLRLNIIEGLQDQLFRCEQVKNIQKIDLSQNRLKILPESLFELPHLKSLDVSSNELERLPDTRFPHCLRYLRLNNNSNLSHFPSAENVPVGCKLRILDISHDKFRSIPDAVYRMTELEEFNFQGNNSMTKIPTDLSDLHNLESLHWPETITDPSEEYRKNTKVLLDHLETKKRKSEEEHTIKVILIGPKGHGKSTLFKNITQGDTVLQEGISIHTVEMNEVSVEVWDFSDMEMHKSAVQPFCTPQCLYVLVWNPIEDDTLYNIGNWFEYLFTWLSCSFSVIVVATHTDHILDDIRNNYYENKRVELYQLIESRFSHLKYPLRIDYHFMTLLTENEHFANELDELKKKIVNSAKKVEKHPGTPVFGQNIPKLFRDIKTRISQCNKPVLTREEFVEICQQDQNNIPDQFDIKHDLKKITSYLNSIGKVVNLKEDNVNSRRGEDAIELNSDLYFTNPSWLYKKMCGIARKQPNSYLLRLNEIFTDLGQEEITIRRFLYKSKIMALIKADLLLVPSNLLQHEPRLVISHPIIRYHKRRYIPKDFWTCLICRLLGIFGEILPTNYLELVDECCVYDDEELTSLQEDSQESTHDPSHFPLINKEFSSRHCTRKTPDNNSVQPKVLTEEKPIDLKTLFTNDLIDLVNAGYLKCWQRGILFKHSHLTFCIKQSTIEENQAIETQVFNNKLGKYAVCFLMDQIRSTLMEWYNNNSPVVSYLGCPVCLNSNIDPPFLIPSDGAVFDQVRSGDESACMLMCEINHLPLTIDVKKHFSDMFLLDIDRISPEVSDVVIGKGQQDTQIFEGSFHNATSEQQVAIKNIDLDITNTSHYDRFMEVRHEVVMTRKLRHCPYVIECLGICFPTKIVLERAPLGSLFAIIDNEKRWASLTRLLKFKICIQVASAIDYMHKRGVIHRDIKSQNILLFSTKLADEVNVKVSDYGTADFQNPSGLNCALGTEKYKAPELYSRRYFPGDYTQSVDIYSLALVVYEMIVMLPPFNGQDANEINEIRKGLRPLFYNEAAAFYGLYPLTLLMKRMWSQDASSRPSAQHVVKQLSSKPFQLLCSVLQCDRTPVSICYAQNDQQPELWMLSSDNHARSMYIEVGFVFASGSLHTFDEQKAIAVEIVKSIIVNKKFAQISAISYSGSNAQFQFKLSSHFCKVINSLKNLRSSRTNKEPIIYSALKLAQEALFNAENGARPGARKKLFVFVVGNVRSTLKNMLGSFMPQQIVLIRLGDEAEHAQLGNLDGVHVFDNVDRNQVCHILQSAFSEYKLSVFANDRVTYEDTKLTLDCDREPFISVLGENFVCAVSYRHCYVYNVKQRAFVRKRAFSHEITSVGANNTDVVVGLVTGECFHIKIDDFVNDEDCGEEIGSLTKKKVVSIAMGDTFSLHAFGRYVLYRDLSQQSDSGGWTIQTCESNLYVVQQIVLSDDNKTLFVAFRKGLKIYVYNVERREKACEIEHTSFVTCMCYVRDQLWVGDSIGGLVVYSAKSADDTNSEVYIRHTVFYPYHEAITNIVVRSNQSRQRLLISEGRVLNKQLFGENSVVEFTGEFPCDDGAPEQLTVTLPQCVLLVWHPLDLQHHENISFLATST